MFAVLAVVYHTKFEKRSKNHTNDSFFTNILRSIRQEVFYEKGVLRNFTRFLEKHLRQSFFFDKAAGLRSATLLKIGPGTGVFL